MRNKLIRIVAVVCGLVGVLFGQAWAAEDPILKVGLFYSSNALPAANLLNETGYGSGYRLGYFDSSRSFISLLETEERKVTVVKDKLIYIGADETYYDVVPGSYETVIGPYHLQLNENYNDMEQVQAAVNRMSALGLTAFPAFVNGQYVVRIGAYDTQNSAEIARGSAAASTGLGFSVVGYSQTCYTVTVTGQGRILFEFDSNSTPLGIMPKSVQGVKTRTWFKNYSYYGGFEYNRVNGNDITVMGVVSENDYIKGVIPYEMSPSWPIDALKAQALCAKSYGKISMGKHKSSGFDLCNTTDCQVYYGTRSATANSDRAVEEVTGQYVIYGGKPAQAYYHSSSGGHTEDVENIWGGAAVPYLRGVPDPYLQGDSWTYSVSLDMVTKILQLKNYTVSEITDYYVSKYSIFGNVLQVTFVDKQYGKLVFNGEKARTIINSDTYKVYTKSHRYTVSAGGGTYVGKNQVKESLTSLFAIGKDRTPQQLTGNPSELKVLSKDGIGSVSQGGSSGDYIIQGSGAGHNIGMSQRGARTMAETGMNYEQIIKHFFTGVTIGNVN